MDLLEKAEADKRALEEKVAQLKEQQELELEKARKAEAIAKAEEAKR
jgi:hypothetical protein